MVTANMARNSSSHKHNIAKKEKLKKRKMFVCMLFIVLLAGAGTVYYRDGRSFRNPPIHTRTKACFHWKDALEDESGAHDMWFVTHFRLTIKTFRKLMEVLKPHFVQKRKRRPGRPLEFKVLCALAYLSSEGDMRYPAILMGCSKSEISKGVSEVTSILSKLAKSTINFAKLTRPQLEEIAEGFEDINGFPNVLGAVDGCLVKIQRPADYEGWYCRKGFTAMNMQCICDHNMRILSYSIMSGCHNDKMLWQHSNIGRDASMLIPKGYHLIGDSGYTLQPWLLIPYTDFDDVLRRKYNYKLSSTRMKIENCYGLLKNRWRMLKSELPMKSMRANVQILEACLFLHNLCVAESDEAPIDDARNAEDKEEYEVDDSTLRIIAITKRDLIAELL
jgi:hypothetical protein